MEVYEAKTLNVDVHVDVEARRQTNRGEKRKGTRKNKTLKKTTDARVEAIKTTTKRDCSFPVKLSSQHTAHSTRHIVYGKK